MKNRNNKNNSKAPIKLIKSQQEYILLFVRKWGNIVFTKVNANPILKTICKRRNLFTINTFLEAFTFYKNNQKNNTKQIKKYTLIFASASALSTSSLIIFIQSPLG